MSQASIADEPLKNDAQELVELKNKVSKIEEYLEVGIKTQMETVVSAALTPIIQSLGDRLKQIDERMMQPQQQSGAGGGSSFIERIIKMVTERIGGSEGGSSGSFSIEVEGMMRDIIKADLKEMVWLRRRNLPAELRRSEEIQHVER